MSWGAQHQTTMAMVRWTLEALGMPSTVWVVHNGHVLGRYGHNFEEQGMPSEMIVPLVQHITSLTMRDFTNDDALPPGILWRSGPMGHVDLLKGSAVQRWLNAFPVIRDEWSHELVGCRSMQVHTPELPSPRAIPAESTHDTSMNREVVTDAVLQPDMTISKSIRGLNLDRDWENRRTLFSCNILIKFLTGRTIEIDINDAMRIKDLNNRIMENIEAMSIDWSERVWNRGFFTKPACPFSWYDKMPRLVYRGRILPARSEDTFLTCAYRNLWTDAVLHAFSPIYPAPVVDIDEEGEMSSRKNRTKKKSTRDEKAN